MKIYKLSIYEVVNGAQTSNAVLVEHFKNKEDAEKKKNETRAGLLALLGTNGRYAIEIQDIDVKE